MQVARGFYSFHFELHTCRYDDKSLGDLLAVKGDLCGRRFEVKVDDVVFVGFPLLANTRNAQPTNKRETPTMVSFNVVFALQVGILNLEQFCRVATSPADVLTHSDNFDEVAKASEASVQLQFWMND